MIGLSTSLGTAYVLGLWIGDGVDWVVVPFVVYTNNALAAGMFQDAYQQYNCDECVWNTCMYDVAASQWATFSIQWKSAREESIGINVIGVFGCGILAIGACSPPVVVIPLLGPSACVGTATCAVASAACLARDGLASYCRTKGYRDCLCEQSRQRAAGQPVGACTAPIPPSCVGL